LKQTTSSNTIFPSSVPNTLLYSTVLSSSVILYILLIQPCIFNNLRGGYEGKMVLDDIMKICRVDNVSADLGNPNITYYNEGARAVGLKIKKIINKKEIEHVRVK
jgi:hypothetical protein